MVANSDYVGDGYGMPTSGMIEALTLVARTEAILLDPVYSGKGMAGFIDLIRKGQFKKGRKYRVRAYWWYRRPIRLQGPASGIGLSNLWPSDAERKETVFIRRQTMSNTLAATATALALTAAFACAPASAEGHLDRIKSSAEITLGHRESSIPFSYLDDKQQPLGYSLDICYGVVDALKEKLGLPDIKIKYVAVTASTRIPLIANGTLDLNCGSSTNTVERQVQVAFAPTTFITATRFLAKKSSNLNTLADFKGKTIVSTAGTSNIRWVTGANQKQNLGMNIIPAKDHAEAFLTVENDRASAFFMDDILLAGLVATSRNPGEWMISKDAYTIEPYAIMEPKGDPEFKKVVDDAIVGMMKDGTIDKLYKKWFESPIPPKNVNLNWPMSEELKHALANPSDTADPDHYK